MIIDGKSLARYVPSKGPFTDLSARFLTLAMKCKVVICCRVSPLQKVCSFVYITWFVFAILIQSLYVGSRRAFGTQRYWCQNSIHRRRRK